MHALQTQLRDHIEIKIRQVRHAIEPGRIVGQAEARMFRRQHIEIAGEILHERQRCLPQPDAPRRQRSDLP